MQHKASQLCFDKALHPPPKASAAQVVLQVNTLESTRIAEQDAQQRKIREA